MAPLTVSCMMVTQRSRTAMARQAINDFIAQDYPHKELVIVSDDDLDLGVPYHRVPAGLKLGDLRNLAVARSDTDLVAQWDDDDLYHPQRLSQQVAMLEKYPGMDGCVLQRWQVAWPMRNTYVISNRRKWEGSLVARRYQLPCYPSLSRGEDMPPIENMNLFELDEPHLYTYVIHGANTYDDAHFNGIVSWCTPLPDDEIARIKLTLGVPT